MDRALGHALGPALAVGEVDARLNPADDRRDQAVIQRLRPRLPSQPVGPGGADVPPHRLDVESEWGGDPFFGAPPNRSRRTSLTSGIVSSR
jgi:hypothetical protein